MMPAQPSANPFTLFKCFVYAPLSLKTVMIAL